MMEKGSYVLTDKERAARAIRVAHFLKNEGFSVERIDEWPNMIVCHLADTGAQTAIDASADFGFGMGTTRDEFTREGVHFRNFSGEALD